MEDDFQITPELIVSLVKNKDKLMERRRRWKCGTPMELAYERQKAKDAESPQQSEEAPKEK